MEIQVELTEQDHKDFYKDYGFKRNWIRRALILLLVVLIISVYLQKDPDNVLWTKYFLELFGIVIVLFPCFFVGPYLVAKAKFKRSYENDLSALSVKIFKPFAVGVEVISKAGNAFLRYETIKQAGKAGNYVFLILLDGDYYLLPKWCFSSTGEVDHFLRLVNSGITNERGTAPRGPFRFKSVYLAGLLCFIPVLGVFVGMTLIILGATSYKDKVLVIIGVLGMLFTFGFLGYVTHSDLNSLEFKNALQESAQMQLNTLVKDIEFYKLQNGVYPNSLQQLNSKDNSIIMDDPIQIEKHQHKSTLYNYNRVGSKYVLFSSGIDGIVDTKDDIYPTLSNPDTSKLGFIRKMSDLKVKPSR